MGMPTGQRKTWTAHRVSSLRRVYGIPDYHSAEKNGEWLTMSEAATTFAVTQHRIRRLIKDGILPAEQVVPRIKSGRPTCTKNASPLRSPEKAPRVASLRETNLQCLQTLEEAGHNERVFTVLRHSRLVPSEANNRARGTAISTGPNEPSSRRERVPFR